MSKKLNYEEVKQYVENLGFILISTEYKSVDSKLIIKDGDGYYYNISLSNLKGGNPSKIVHKSNPYSIYNINLWCKINNRTIITISSIFINSKINLVWQCENCNEKFEENWMNICNGYKCPNCNITHRHKTCDYIENFVNNLGYELLNNNKDIYARTKLVLKDKNGYLYSSCYSDLNSGYMPYFTALTNPYSIHNINHWVKINNKSYKLLSLIYKSATDKLQFKCLQDNCSEIFEMSWDCISRDYNCPFCAGKQVGLSNCLVTKRPDLATEWHPTLNGDLTIYDVTINYNKKVWWQCKENPKHEWYASPNQRNNLNSGCPECVKSKGEVRIQMYLDNNSIKYVPQYKIDNCRYKKPLPFDFAIFNNNKLLFLCEYQGKQHYEPVDFFGGEKQLKLQEKLDYTKEIYCKNNKISLLRIPYWEYDKIEQILQKELNINNLKECVNQ